VKVGINGSNNQMMISGSGSAFVGSGEYSALYVGHEAGSSSQTCTNNGIQIQDGGEATAVNGYIGNGNGGGWVNDNWITVTGSNSVLTLSESFHVGEGRAIGNRLLIENGGRVSNTEAYIGSGSSQAEDNSASVTGAGSIWTSSGSVYIGEQWGSVCGKNGALNIEDSASVVAKTVTVNGSYPGIPRLMISDGFLATEQIKITSGYLMLTNAVLQWTSQTNATPFMILGGGEQFAGTTEIRIVVSSRSAMEHVSLDLMSGLDNPADTNLFDVLFLDTSSDQLYRPEGASYGFDTNTVVWSISTDDNTEFVPTPPVPVLSIEMSGGSMEINVQYIPEGTTMYLQDSTNLLSGSWSNLYEASGTTATNWRMRHFPCGPSSRPKARKLMENELSLLDSLHLHFFSLWEKVSPNTNQTDYMSTVQVALYPVTPYLFLRKQKSFPVISGICLAKQHFILAQTTSWISRISLAAMLNGWKNKKSLSSG
jgi:T5SS/PEP-CTERM-associated repeat protein